MIEARRFLGLLICCVGIASCAQDAADSIDVGVAREALSACNETVPDTRYIDGIPSYAQCPETESSAIFSNNGIDTATASMGADWVRTQYSGGYQCTELAHRYLLFKWQVKWLPNGNAGFWCDTMPPANSGMTQTMAPVHGDIMVLAPGSCGADGTTGHVNVVDVVDTAKAKVTVVEQNGARRGSYNQTCAKCFLHVVANNGTSPGTTIVPPPAAGAAAAAGAPAQQAGAGAPTKRPAPAAGSAAPPPASPPAEPTPTTPIAPPAPATAGSIAPAPPAAPSSSAAGSAATPTTTPTTPVAARGGDAADSGCSISEVRGSAATTQLSAALLMLAMIAVARLQRRRRRVRA
jgi:surface antigen